MDSFVQRLRSKYEEMNVQDMLAQPHREFVLPDMSQ